jgi:hypothetical protein
MEEGLEIGDRRERKRRKNGEEGARPLKGAEQRTEQRVKIDRRGGSGKSKEAMGRGE